MYFSGRTAHTEPYSTVHTTHYAPVIGRRCLQLGQLKFASKIQL